MNTTRQSNNDFNKVTSWAKQELANLQRTSTLPICIALSNGNYTVATYKIVKQSPVCWVVDNKEFTDKRSAIFYCSLLHLNRDNEAYDLYRIDTYVGRLDIEKSIFRVRLDSAHSSADQFKIDMYSSRYEQVKRKLAAAKRKLDIILQTCAKYNIDIGK